MQFGHLQVLSYGRHRGQGAWRCECACGTILFVMSGSLRSGRSKSCGCPLRWEATSRQRSEHGHRRHLGRGTTPEYRAWTHLRARCSNVNDRAYANYGGRGITVCAAWDADFRAFLADVGLRPGPSYSLDRIDVNGHYEPGNVRWATRRQQSLNRRPIHRGANSTGMRGVTLTPAQESIRRANRWHVRIAVEGRILHLASCADECSARLLAREAFLIRDALFPEWS